MATNDDTMLIYYLLRVLDYPNADATAILLGNQHYVDVEDLLDEDMDQDSDPSHKNLLRKCGYSAEECNYFKEMLGFYRCLSENPLWQKFCAKPGLIQQNQTHCFHHIINFWVAPNSIDEVQEQLTKMQRVRAKIDQQVRHKRRFRRSEPKHDTQEYNGDPSDADDESESLFAERRAKKRARQTENKESIYVPGSPVYAGPHSPTSPQKATEDLTM